MADALLLSSQRVQPEKLAKIGYKFRYETLPSALQAILAIS
jgi:NAD dependent epimerase/dehydratase family enzyme